MKLRANCSKRKPTFFTAAELWCWVGAAHAGRADYLQGELVRADAPASARALTRFTILLFSVGMHGKPHNMLGFIINFYCVLLCDLESLWCLHLGDAACL